MTSSRDRQILAARLARMKAMLDALEGQCMRTQQTREMFDKLQRELATARESLKPAQ